MGLIEQAAKRLEELRRAGVEAPAVKPASDEHREVAPLAPGAPGAPVAAVAASAARPVARAARLNLDLAALASRGCLTPELPRSRIADEFRVIKRPLIANIAEPAASRVPCANLIMVTSSLPGEGKTFTAINLAMSIAMEIDRTVLLVDADVARPSLPQALGIPDGPGLLDVLEGRVKDIGEVLHPTNVEKLTFVTSGRMHARASEMLASDAMTSLLAELSERYPDRVVIFDSPPQLVTTEARVLATHMGQVVFVVAAAQTLQSEVSRALAMIEACPIKLLVLNKVEASGKAAYGYGYGYGA